MSAFLISILVSLVSFGCFLYGAVLIIILVSLELPVVQVDACDKLIIDLQVIILENSEVIISSLIHNLYKLGLL